ncbi:MAG: lamin tail domain-containing protein [bacterium]|nr:lamin tail domain-containing protein [bacterium]
MRLRWLGLVTCSVWLAGVATGALVITEVMSSSSHPTGGRWDWFEVYNSGPGAVNLTGYTWVDDNASHTNVFLPPWVLAAGETLLVTEGPVGGESSFQAMWGLPTNALVYNMGAANFWGLGSGGDFVKVFNPTGGVVAQAVFGAATQGRTFHWSREGTYLGVSQAGQHGAYVALSNGVDGVGTDVGSPGNTVSVPTLSSFVVGMMDAGVATAKLGQAVAVQSFSISNGVCAIGYGRTTNGVGWVWGTNMVPVVTGGAYVVSGVIAPVVPGRYYYAARWDFNGFSCYGWNSRGQTNEISLRAEYSIVWTNTLRAPYPGEVLVTEVMSSSAHTNSAANGDWYELYYFGSEPASLAGCSFDDNSVTPGLHILPEIQLMPGAVVVIVDEGTNNVATFAAVWGVTNGQAIFSRDVLVAGSFQSFSSEGDQLHVYDPYNELLTSVSFGAASNGYSFYWPVERDPFSPGAPLISVEGVEGAWRAVGGEDVGSPGVVVPEPIGSVLAAVILGVRRKLRVACV